MADKLACTYRYVRKDGDKVSRVILSAGSDVPKDLDEEEVKQLKKDGLIVDEKRLSEDNLRLPYGHPDSVTDEPAGADAQGQQEQEQEPQPQASNVEAKQQEAGTPTSPDAKKQTAAGNKGS